MGTRKKLFLASLVSLTMVLAFTIGLVPGLFRAGAAPGSDNVDMQSLIDLMLNDSAKQVGVVTLDSDWDGFLVKTPAGNTEQQEIVVPLTAAAGTGDTVTFVANAGDDVAFDGASSTWTGDTYTDPLDSPWEGALDVGALFANAAESLGATVPIYIYALTNAVEETKQISLVYEQSNAPADAVKLTVEETAAATDANANAFPDDLLAQVGPGEIWLANRGIDKQTGSMRYVAIANLAGAPGTLSFGPTANVSVEVPTFDSLLQGAPEGWDIEEGEAAYAIVEVTGSLAALLDEADGGATAVADWAASVEALQPGMLAGASSYVNVSLIYTLEGQTLYDEIKDLTDTGLSVTIMMDGLGLGAFDVPKMFSYPTEVMNADTEFALTNEAGLQTWTEVAGADISVANSDAMATVQELSVFAILDAGLSITSVNQATIPQGYTSNLVLHGVVPTMTDLSASQASALFEVTVGGQAAAFRDGELKQAETGAISAWTGTGLQTINIVAPALTTTGPVTIVITEIANPSNTATATGLLSVVATHEVTVSVAGQGAYTPMATASDITLTPANTPPLPDGVYLHNTHVTGSIALDASEVLVGWELNGTAVGTSLSFNVTNDTEVVAIVGPASTEGFRLDVVVSPFGAGTVQIAPMPDNDGRYAAGTEVTLTAAATPGLDFTFADWTGNVANPASATTTIIMNQDQVVTANFAGGNTFTLTIAVNNATMGTTAPAPGTYVCAAGSHRGIEALANQGYQFVGWTGDVVDAMEAETEVVMDANKTVTANFMVPPTTDGIQLTPEEIAAGITRPEVWLFGGVSRVIAGNGLTNATPIFVGDTATGNVVQVQGYNAAADGTSVMILMPPVPDGLLAAGAMNVEVDLALGGTIGDYGQVFENAILYKRHASQPITGSTAMLNTTAFMLESSEASNVQVSIGGGEFATLELPALEDAAHGRTLYGIARNAQILSLDAKNNTAPIESLQMGTGALANVAAAGDYVSDSIEFSFYLYQEPQEVKWNTDTVGPQQPNEPFLVNAMGASGGSLFDIPAPLNPDGTANPASSPALLTIDAKNAFTYADVRKGLAMWGVESAYDYATNVLTVPDPAADAYQSTLLANNVNPALTANSVDAANPDLVVKARLYSLNGFSLRKNWSLPADIAALVMLQTANGSGTASGSMCGGTELTVVSPMGGLGFVDHVTLTSSAKAISASVTIPPTGASETQFTFKTPEVKEPGIVDLTIYLRSNPAPAVVLPRVFEYKQESTPLDSLALILLGLLVALIGLIAGGNSGGGGGGPCFIATAAYGTPMAADIDTLRTVRDTFLLDNTIGTAFVDAYYQASPAIADVVAQSPALAALVRILLVPVVFLGKVALAMPLLTALVGLSLGFAFFMRRRSAHKA